MSNTVYRVALCGLLGLSDEWRSIFTISMDGASVYDMPLIADWIHGMYNVGMLSRISNRVTADHFILEKVVNGKWSYVDEYPISIHGTSESDALPNQIAAVVIGITPSRRRGKKFIPGICEDLQSQGVLNDSILPLLTNFAQSWTDPSSAVEGALWGSGVCKPDGTDFLQFTNYRVDKIVGTQRRRKQGKGS
jgi:hypothetical protein